MGYVVIKKTVYRLYTDFLYRLKYWADDDFCGVSCPRVSRLAKCVTEKCFDYLIAYKL